ncbi:MAG: hypothetical protein HQ556_03195 [Candidatus Marinimicrobia bacterium]|nr:hypothetical protein [Candidatus Neomarinimicrobiota bacterium]
MGYYDRDSRYNNFEIRDTPESHFKNNYISKWWKREYDKLILKYVHNWHWAWYDAMCYDFPEIIVKDINEDITKHWKNTDPLCSRYPNAWRHTIETFALGRYLKLKYNKNIDKPKRKHCRLCNNLFTEDSLPFPLLHRLNKKDNVHFCSLCLFQAFLDKGNNNSTAEEIIHHFQQLSEILQIIPFQNFGSSPMHFRGLDLNQIERVAKLFIHNKPSLERIKKVFGSWLNCLIKSKILSSDVRETNRGTHCLANDGHACLSLGEKMIDDYLFQNGIEHQKEPRYPEGKFRADFKVDDIFIEYFGLSGDKDYDNRVATKINLCKKHNIELIQLYPKDLLNIAKLDKKLQPLHIVSKRMSQ